MIYFIREKRLAKCGGGGDMRLTTVVLQKYNYMSGQLSLRKTIERTVGKQPLALKVAQAILTTRSRTARVTGPFHLEKRVL